MFKVTIIKTEVLVQEKINKPMDHSGNSRNVSTYMQILEFFKKIALQNLLNISQDNWVSIGTHTSHDKQQSKNSRCILDLHVKD